MFFFFISPFGMGQVRNGDANNLNLLVVGAMVVTFLLSALLSEGPSFEFYSSNFGYSDRTYHSQRPRGAHTYGREGGMPHARGPPPPETQVDATRLWDASDLLNAVQIAACAFVLGRAMWGYLMSHAEAMAEWSPRWLPPLMARILQHFYHTWRRVLAFGLRQFGEAGHGEAGPATAAGLASLRHFSFEERHFFLEGNPELSCAVCMDKFKVGDGCTKMPCQHVFHKDCVLPWLAKRSTCPMCRFELETGDPVAEVGRQTRMRAEASVN